MKILFKGPYDSSTYKPSPSQSKTETVYQEVKVIIDGVVLGALMLSREQVNMLYKSALAEGEYAPVEIRGLHVDMGDKPPEPTLKRRLIVDVVYQPNGVAAGILESLLMRIPDDTAGNGLFTGDTAAEVKGWSAKIEEGP